MKVCYASCWEREVFVPNTFLTKKNLLLPGLKWITEHLNSIKTIRIIALNCWRFFYQHTIEKRPTQYSSDGIEWDKTSEIQLNRLLSSECWVLFCYQEVRVSSLEDQFVVVWVSTLGFDRIIVTISQANVARIERLIEEIPEVRYRGKQRERMAHSRQSRLGRR